MRNRTNGQSLPEYTITLAVVGVILVVATSGNPSPLQQFSAAVAEFYGNLTYSLSVL